MNDETREEIQEAIDQLESEETITLQLSDDDTVDICAADFFIGGTFENDEVMCEMLGNVMYSKQRILKVLEKYLAEDDVEIVDILF